MRRRNLFPHISFPDGICAGRGINHFKHCGKTQALTHKLFRRSSCPPSRVETRGALRGPPDAPATVWERPGRKGFSRGGREADFQRGFQLRARHAVIPFEELFERAAAVEMVEERLRRDARAFEDQRAAHHLRMLRENVRQFIFTCHAQTMLPFGFEVKIKVCELRERPLILFRFSIGGNSRN